MVLLVVAVGALAVVLPRVVESAGFREQAQAAVRDQLGLELEYASLGVGLLPPRVRVEEPRLLSEGGEPDLEAQEIAVHVALLPLFAGALVVDRVQVDGAVFQLVRNTEGIALRSGVPIPLSSSGTAPDDEAEAGSPITLRHFVLSGARITFEDRTLRPPRTLGVDDLGIDVELRDDGMDLDGSGRLSVGGELAVAAKLVGDDLDASLELDRVGVDGLAFLANEYGITDLGGLLDGSVEATLSGGAPTAATLDLRLADGSLVRDTLALSGPMKIEGTLSSADGGGIEGPIGIDLTDAAVVLDGSFHKRPGDTGRLDGRLAQDAEGAIAFDGQLRLLDLSGDVVLRSGDRTSLRIDSKPFELSGWHETVPALGNFEADGPARFAGLRMVEGSNGKFVLDGGIELNGVKVKLSESGEPFTLRGMVTGLGPSLLLNGLRAESPGGPVQIDGRIDVLTDDMGYVIELDTPEAVESEGFIASFADLRSTLFGPLGLRGKVQGSLATERSLVEDVRGAIDFSVGANEATGRLVGVSILKMAVDQFGELGAVALMAGPLRRGKTLDDYYSEEFELLAGSITLRSGRARTQDLRLEYEGYEVLLRGSIGLTEMDLDMVGTIKLSPEIDAKLSGGKSKRVRSIPIAHIGGDVSSPKLALTQEVVAEFASGYLLGAGLDALGDLLGKNRRKSDAGSGSSDSTGSASGDPASPGGAVSSGSSSGADDSGEVDAGALLGDLLRRTVNELSKEDAEAGQ